MGYGEAGATRRLWNPACAHHTQHRARVSIDHHRPSSHPDQHCTARIKLPVTIILAPTFDPHMDPFDTDDA